MTKKWIIVDACSGESALAPDYDDDDACDGTKHGRAEPDSDKCNDGGYGEGASIGAPNKTRAVHGQGRINTRGLAQLAAWFVRRYTFPPSINRRLQNHGQSGPRPFGTTGLHIYAVYP
jgi:hypothetical protein